MCATRRGSSGPSDRMTCCNDRDGRYSITIQVRPAASKTSYTCTTLGWLSRAAARASRRVRC
jgi:hypothetical protein